MWGEVDVSQSVERGGPTDTDQVGKKERRHGLGDGCSNGRSDACAWERSVSSDWKKGDTTDLRARMDEASSWVLQLASLAARY